MAEMSRGPHVGVLSSQFPSSVVPAVGLSIRERMFRVARRLPLFVVSPTPWLPLQDWVRQYWKQDFSPSVPEYEEQQGIPVWYPRFLSVPDSRLKLKSLRRFDGWSMALAAYSRFAALRNAGRLDVIDAHGVYPDGEAGVLLGRRLGVPCIVTLHGGELAHAGDPHLTQKLRATLMSATRVFAVSEALRQFAIEMGLPGDRVEVISNGVDAERFCPRDRNATRAALGLSPDAPVLISVGRLTEEKGQHRVIEVLPSLLQRWPGLVYLIVGPDNPGEGRRAELETQARRRGIEASVRFLGALSPGDLAGPLSAADVFVLAARREGGSNAFLEAMACGLPVVATDTGGNRETVCRPELGELVSFGELSALEAAIERALSKSWDRAAIRRHAEANNWDGRIDLLCRRFTDAAGRMAK